MQRRRTIRTYKCFLIGILLYSPYQLTSFSYDTPFTKHHRKHEFLKSPFTSARKAANSDSPDVSFDKNLIRSLDLHLLLRAVSKHCATHRGKEAILQLINEDKKSQRGIQTKGGNLSSERLRQMYEYDSFSSNNKIDLNQSQEYTPVEKQKHKKSSIIKIASSSNEATEQYILVEKATQILERSKSKKDLLPPFYGFSSSPYDTSEVTTDYDEWLRGGPTMLELENILQAEQITKTLLHCYDWAKSMPKELANIMLEDSEKENEILEDLYHSTLEGAVKIRRGSTLSSTYAGYIFEFNDEKYPDLQKLKKKAQQLLKTVDESKSSSQMKKLENIREQLNLAERDIQIKTSVEVFKYAHLLEKGLDRISTLDTIFARAAFGTNMDGKIPQLPLQNEGVIDIKSFTHPLLSIRKKADVVPTDLVLGRGVNTVESNVSIERDGYDALIISGPNGGGKTIAMKSFGSAAVMCKLGIPLPTKDTNNVSVNDLTPRVDFFQNIFAQVGDEQNVIDGESTLISKLNGYSDIIDKASQSLYNNTSNEQNYSLILLDEVGSGTDPLSGAGLSRAILEKLTSLNTSRIVCTTHLFQIKTLYFEDNRFYSAAVMLETMPNESELNRAPSFKLSYGRIGESHAISAASRSSLPRDVVSRASDLILSSGDNTDSYSMIEDIQKVLEVEKEMSDASLKKAQSLVDDCVKVRDATISLAKAHEVNLNRLETRLESIYQELLKNSKGVLGNYEFIGDSLSDIRLLRKQVQRQDTILKDRGLKLVPPGHQFIDGETVVIIKPCEYEGQTATVYCPEDSSDTSAYQDYITVIPSFGWFDDFDNFDDDDTTSNMITLKRSEVALWDYPSYYSDGPLWDTKTERKQEIQGKSVEDSNKRLLKLMASIESSPTKSSTGARNVKKNSNSKFTSSRERKAMKKNGKKNKSKKK